MSTTATFQEVARLWKEDKRKWIKPSTYATYVNHVNKHLLPFFGAMQPEQFTEAQVQEYVNGQLGHIRTGTIRDSLMVLRMILRFGRKYCDWPPVEFDVHFPPSSGGNRTIPVLLPADQRRLLGYLSTHFSFRNLGLAICLHTGLRIGEVCALQWKDLDVDTGVIHVRKTIQRIWIHDGAEQSYTLSVGVPKTLTSNRDIPICHELMKSLRPLRKVMADDFYVLSNDAEPLEPRYYRDYFRKLLVQLGLPPIRFHGLRHSFATRCIESKCDYKTVSAILGHSSIATTLDLYVHPGFDEKKKAIEQMAKALRIR